MTLEVRNCLSSTFVIALSFILVIGAGELFHKLGAVYVLYF